MRTYGVTPGPPRGQLGPPRDHEAKGDIALRHVSTERQLANTFTKPLDEQMFCALRSELNILDSRNLA